MRPTSKFALLAAAALLAHAPAHGAPLLPDLVPVANQALSYMYGGVFDVTSEPGRVFYRFDTAIANLGAGPFQLYEETNLTAQTQDIYQDVFDSGGGSTRHFLATFAYETPPFGRLSYQELARYNLRAVLAGGGVGGVVATMPKTSHAVVDSVPINTALPGAPPARVYNSALANPMGVSVGYADLYRRTIAKQRIDVTGLPSGDYWLEVVIDPNGHALESDTTNNTTRIPVSLLVPPAPAGDYNADGQVDAADYVVWRDTLATGAALPNDATPGADAGDHATWAGAFGAGVGAASSAPEPAAWVVLASACGLLAHGRGSRRPLLRPGGAA